jgi:hypothetical protein
VYKVALALYIALDTMHIRSLTKGSSCSNNLGSWLGIPSSLKDLFPF